MWDGDLYRLGWAVRRSASPIREWVASVAEAAMASLDDPENDVWYRCQRSWFVGVDCLPNNELGRVGDGPAFPFDAISGLAPRALHRAQVSAVFPGYPKQDAGDSDAAYRFRMERDAAHVDGLLAVGENRARMIKEPHAWILGMPLTLSDEAASPLAVWEGSHEVMRRAFARAFDGLDQAAWKDLDLTSVYKSTRRQIFEECTRREIIAQPGDAILLHRLALHGIAPWKSEAAGPRIVIYFRPETSVSDWISAP